mmetsp:Transcript_22031/g.44219  ORF Transcript_22031/g.44219 Transcript_22031/m.44219 type:complete len:90 (+) Transcript_22031:1454-1723(+)
MLLFLRYVEGTRGILRWRQVFTLSAKRGGNECEESAKSANRVQIECKESAKRVQIECDKSAKRVQRVCEEGAKGDILECLRDLFSLFLS